MASVPWPDDFINKRQFSIGPVAHGDGTAEEKPAELQVHELARRGDGRGVPRQPQTVRYPSASLVFSVTVKVICFTIILLSADGLHHTRQPFHLLLSAGSGPGPSIL